MSVLISWDLILRLMNCFPDCVINSNADFIAHIKSFTCFNLKICENETDVKCKVLERFSRSAYQTGRYKWMNKYMLDGINKFLNTNFAKIDIEKIYIHLGNACDHTKTLKFIASGYDMAVLRE